MAPTVPAHRGFVRIEELHGTGDAERAPEGVHATRTFHHISAHLNIG